ncbi:hypothetical protein C8R45DRAFT_1037741, partial [Mycena sanguinolenta]
MLQFPPAPVKGLRFINLQNTEGYLGCIMLALGNDASKRMSFLINLRTEEYVVFDCGMTSAHQLHPIPGYLLVSCSSEPLSLPVDVYSISSLARLWRPFSDLTLENATSESVIAQATVLLEGREGPRDSSFHVDVFVVASLLRQNAYLLRVFDTVRYRDKSLRTASTHRLDLSQQTPQCILLSTSTYSTGELVWISAVSRAGYSILPPSQRGFRVVRLDNGEETFIGSDGAGRSYHVALPHNGGLVVVHESKAELLYY